MILKKEILMGKMVPKKEFLMGKTDPKKEILMKKINPKKETSPKRILNPKKEINPIRKPYQRSGTTNTQEFFVVQTTQALAYRATTSSVELMYKALWTRSMFVTTLASCH